jgi:hypothetical protein
MPGHQRPERKAGLSFSRKRAERRRQHGDLVLCRFPPQLRYRNLYRIHSPNKRGISERDRLVALLTFAPDVGEAEQPLRRRLELRFKHVPDTVLSLEGTVRDPESDVGADQGVVRHDVSLVETRLLLLESGEHLRDLTWDPPGQREFLGGRKDVVYVVVAISQESTGCAAEEECLRARVDCADQGLQALCGCDKGTGIHAWSLMSESACSIGLRLAALSLTRRRGLTHSVAIGC